MAGSLSLSENEESESRVETPISDSDVDGHQLPSLINSLNLSADEKNVNSTNFSKLVEGCTNQNDNDVLSSNISENHPNTNTNQAQKSNTTNTVGFSPNQIHQSIFGTTENTSVGKLFDICLSLYGELMDDGELEWYFRPKNEDNDNYQQDKQNLFLLRTWKEKDDFQKKKAMSILFQDLQRMIDTLGLYSPNDILEDITTKDLIFFLVPYYHGNIHARYAINDTRENDITTSLSLYKKFMHQCENILLLTDDDLKYWEELESRDSNANESDHNQISNERDFFGKKSRAQTEHFISSDVQKTLEQYGFGRQVSSKDANHRERKIQRQKMIKHAKDRLKYIATRLNRSNGIRSNNQVKEDHRSPETSFSYISRSEDDDDVESDIEELQRDNVLLLIKCAIWHVMDEIPLLKQELEFHLYRKNSHGSLELDQRTSSSISDPRMKDRQVKSTRHNYSKNSYDNQLRKPVHTPIELTHLDVVNGQLRVRREEIKKNALFHNPNLPTMSIEEFAHLEYQDMKARERKESELQKTKTDADYRYKYKQLIEMGKEDNEALVDIATIEDRAWDDWKDENPRGSGNKAGKLF